MTFRPVPLLFLVVTLIFAAACARADPEPAATTICPTADYRNEAIGFGFDPPADFDGPVTFADDRVVPGHSFKFAAALQHCQSGLAPSLIRIETRAGHGAGKPTSKLIEEIADQWAFLIKNLNGQ